MTQTVDPHSYTNSVSQVIPLYCLQKPMWFTENVCVDLIPMETN